MFNRPPTHGNPDSPFSKFPVNATPLDERFEHLDTFWQRWQTRPAFLAAYADGLSGVSQLDKRP